MSAENLCAPQTLKYQAIAGIIYDFKCIKLKCFLCPLRCNVTDQNGCVHKLGRKFILRLNRIFAKGQIELFTRELKPCNDTTNLLAWMDSFELDSFGHNSNSSNVQSKARASVSLFSSFDVVYYSKQTDKCVWRWFVCITIFFIACLK